MIKKTAVAATLVSALAAGCNQVPMQPSDSHIRSDDLRPDGAIPPPVQYAPTLPKPKASAAPETYSVVVNNVRVQELLFALARDAKLNVDIHPDVAGTVTLNAIDQTLPQLLSRLARQIDLRYEVHGNTIFVTPDTPYLRTYRVDYLNMSRDTTSDVALSTSIGGGASGGTGAAGGAGGGSPAGGGTTQRITNRSNNHFWDALINNAKDILRETDKVIPAQGAAVAVAPAPTPATPPGTPGAAAASAPPPPAAPTTATFREAASVIANPEAGILTIRATGRQHEKIQEFLDQVLTSASRQVLVEATVVEVRLNNQYQQGINWSRLRGDGTGFRFAQPGANTGPAAVNTSNFSIGYLNSARTLDVLLRFLESFGTLKVLSSPKVSVLNNQTAMLRVVDNLVYFTIKSDISQNQTQTVQVFTTTVNPYSVGFVMSVTPQISDSDRVLLNVRPTITRQIGSAVDPNPALAQFNITNTVPLLQTRELESLLHVQSGQIAVMGGLMQDEVDQVEDGIPGVNRIPGVNQLLRQYRSTNNKTELVIFLRPTVLRDASVDGDFKSFRNFMADEDFLRRPNPGKPAELGQEVIK
jgi:general secretion pathway protein D